MPTALEIDRIGAFTCREIQSGIAFRTEWIGNAAGRARQAYSTKKVT